MIKAYQHFPVEIIKFYVWVGSKSRKHEMFAHHFNWNYRQTYLNLNFHWENILAVTWTYFLRPPMLTFSIRRSCVEMDSIFYYKIFSFPFTLSTISWVVNVRCVFFRRGLLLTKCFCNVNFLKRYGWILKPVDKPKLSTKIDHFQNGFKLRRL